MVRFVLMGYVKQVNEWVSTDPCWITWRLERPLSHSNTIATVFWAQIRMTLIWWLLILRPPQSIRHDNETKGNHSPYFLQYKYNGWAQLLILGLLLQYWHANQLTLNITFIRYPCTCYSIYHNPSKAHHHN